MQADLRDFQKRSLYPVFQPAQVTPGQQYSIFFFFFLVGACFTSQHGAIAEQIKEKIF